MNFRQVDAVVVAIISNTLAILAYAREINGKLI